MNINKDILRVIKPYLDALETRIAALEELEARIAALEELEARIKALEDAAEADS